LFVFNLPKIFDFWKVFCYFGKKQIIVSMKKTIIQFLLSFKFCLYLLLAMHFFGLLFMQFEATKGFFLALTPLNLILSGFFLFYHHQQKNNYFWLAAAFFFMSGFSIEVLGVHTGAIFGNYWYGKSLGLKIWEVPILIGLNWAVLVVATTTSTEKLFALQPTLFSTQISKFLKASVGAAQMTLLDILIEPIAMHLDFWQWQNNTVPLQNYVAWFLVAFVLHLVYQQTNIGKNNPLAVYLLAAQALFFGGFSILLAS
jgi:uncharacterized membrane protein